MGVAGVVGWFTDVGVGADFETESDKVFQGCFRTLLVSFTILVEFLTDNTQS